MIDRGIKGCSAPLPKKGDLEIAKNYRGITLTSIAAKIYNGRLINCIEPEIEKILRKNQNGFRRNRYTSQMLITRWILEGGRVNKKLMHFSRLFDIHRGKMEQILSAYDLPQRNICSHNDDL